MEERNIKNRIALIVAMSIFGTIGIARRYVLLPSGAMALFRAAIGVICLLFFMLFTRRKIKFVAIRRHFLPLLASGVCLGFNWLLLFEAYKYTSVATATLCYYMAPIFLVLAAPLLFGEKMTLKKGVCVLVAFAGMMLVSGVFHQDDMTAGEGKGILFGLAAALLYACIIVLNKRMTDISPFDKTVVQFLVSVLVLLPYVLMTETVTVDMFTPVSVVVLLAVGVIHTGFAYVLYFGSVSGLSATTVAMFSYIDPVLSVLLSFLFFKEAMTLPLGLGAVLILGAAFVSEKK